MSEFAELLERLEASDKEIEVLRGKLDSVSDRAIRIWAFEKSQELLKEKQQYNRADPIAIQGQADIIVAWVKRGE